MKKLSLGSLLTLALLMGYGCNTKTTETTDSAATSSMDDGNMAGDSASNMASTDMNETPTSTETNDFMLTAASGGMMEVTLGQMAQEKGSNAEVKAFGQKMVEDHGKANAELKALAATKNVTLPVEPLAEQQKHIDEMKSMSGADFDQHYASMMVDDHKKDVAAFEKATQYEDANVKAFASKTLPVLKMHLDMIQKINAQVANK